MKTYLHKNKAIIKLATISHTLTYGWGQTSMARVKRLKIQFRMPQLALGETCWGKVFLSFSEV